MNTNLVKMQQCNVVNVCMLVNCYVRSCVPIETRGLPIILAQEFSDFYI